MLYAVFVLSYILVSIFLILVVLLQTGKRADLAGAFGGGGSQTALGTRGAANLLTRLTTVSAILFMLLALTLSIMSSTGEGVSGSVLDDVPAPAGSTPPASSGLPAVPSDDPLGGTPATDLDADSGSADQPEDAADTTEPADGDPSGQP